MSRRICWRGWEGLGWWEDCLSGWMDGWMDGVEVIHGKYHSSVSKEKVALRVKERNSEFPSYTIRGDKGRTVLFE